MNILIKIRRKLVLRLLGNIKIYSVYEINYTDPSHKHCSKSALGVKIHFDRAMRQPKNKQLITIVLVFEIVGKK